MKLKLIAFVMLCVVFTAACQSAVEAESMPPTEPSTETPQQPVQRQPLPPQSGQPKKAAGDQSFTLGEGESAMLEAEQLEVTVVAVTEDSRCPQGAQCFWEGNAKVRVKVGDQEFVLTLGGLREGDQNAVEIAKGLSLRVLAIDPYPGSAQAGQPYQVTLIVEPGASQP